MEDGVRRAARPVTAALVVVLVAVFTGWIWFGVATNQLLDFNVYYLAAEVFARGGDPYDLSDASPSSGWDALAAELDITHFARPYRYPPQTAVLVMLLRPLGPVGAAALWGALNAGAMVAGAWLLGRALGGGWWTPAALLALLFFGPAYDTLLMGQINGLLFLSLVAALWFLKSGGGMGTGVGLAIGGVLKLVPIIIVPYLLLRRRWRLAACWLLASMALVAACLPFIGWTGVSAYIGHAVDLTRPGSVFTGQMNQTLTGVLGRALDDDLAQALARLAAVVLLAATAVFCRNRGDARRWLALEFAAIVAVLGLVFPFTWYHQLVVLLIPLLVVAQEVVEYGRKRAAALLIGLYALTSLHFLIWSSAAAMPYRGWGAAALAEFPFLLGLCLWAAAGGLLIAGKRAEASESAPAAQEEESRGEPSVELPDTD